MPIPFILLRYLWMDSEKIPGAVSLEILYDVKRRLFWREANNHVHVAWLDINAFYNNLRFLGNKEENILQVLD